MAESVSQKAQLGVAYGTFMTRNRESVFKPKVESIIRTLRSDSEIKKLGSVGFCFGARYAMLFSSEGSEPFLDACVGNHPSFVVVPNEVEAIKYVDESLLVRVTEPDRTRSKPLQINVGDVDSVGSSLQVPIRS